MPKDRGEEINDQIIEKAKELGACLAGIASVEALKKSPSHLIYGKLDGYKGVGTRESDKIRPGEVACPENARSAIIRALITLTPPGYWHHHLYHAISHTV